MGEGEKKKLTKEQQDSAAEKSRSRRDRLLVAIHHLEGRLASAAPGREQRWASRVIQALSDLQEGMRERIDAEGGLLSDIEVTAPEQWPRVRRLRAEYAHLKRQIGELVAELQDAIETEVADYRDIRERVGWILTALKHQQSRETDLIFEVYNRDIGVCD